MRLLHTSDWHVGVTLGGKDRLNEHAVFIEELNSIIQEESIDAVLIAGDLYDQSNPPPGAEKLVFDFFRVMAERKIPVVLIAGNHDSGPRIEGRARLLQLVEIHAFGEPRRDAAIEIITKTNEKLVVAALPFAGESRLLHWDEAAAQSSLDQKQTFAERMKGLLDALASTHFKPDAVNVMMAHLTVDGAALSGSERNLRMSDTWTIPSEMLPALGHYIALGHIHKPQVVPNAPIPCAYSGSPLHIDFGEEKDFKGVYVVTAAAGKPIQLDFRPLKNVLPVRTIRTTMKDLPSLSKELHDFTGHIKVAIKLNEEDKKVGVAEEIRRTLPQTLMVQVDAPTPEPKSVVQLTDAGQKPLEAYTLYLESQSRQATPDLVNAFQELANEALHASP